jgi:elongation factor 3
MAPAALHSDAAIKSENSKAVKTLEELMGKLTVSKAQDEINAAANSIATFINGDIEEADAPTKYVQNLPHYPATALPAEC